MRRSEQGLPAYLPPAGGIEIVPHGAAHEPQLPPDDGGLDQQLRRVLMHHEILHDAGAILPCVHAGVGVHEADVRRVAAVQRPLAKIIAESGVAHALGVKGQQAQAVPAGERRLIALLPQHLELPCGRVKEGGAALAAVGRHLRNGNASRPTQLANVRNQGIAFPRQF